MSLVSKFGVITRRLATAAEPLFPNRAIPPAYTLATLRSFPSLEPHAMFPVHNAFLNTPIRRDILWLAVVMELDNIRVGASNPPDRSQHKFSRHKLRPQKGSGMARVGDANSPIRYRGAYALARTAPNDFSSELPEKVYHAAYRTALSSAYQAGKLFVIGNLENSESKLLPGDSFDLETTHSHPHAVAMFVKKHGLEKLNLLFIPEEYDPESNLVKAVKQYGNRARILRKEDVEVRDLLKADRLVVSKETLVYFASKYTKHIL
ncbi:hypothetical protein OGAPHI_002963 [Ogataea philodendri]|uniref:Large ribosomal subunit protein uL4m n=1 Tax=Ogataea philodendri TaxID=1378263 RepID=A0A9P8P9C7_9ASCO|nr:uncharacterized protein OGAPHI_002963 [Ogataea philodendri]KAH3667314.1 hypothetical protein OGAPHI_002963 [Ogataea philodendri]